MKTETLETLNTVIGYTGIGIFFASILFAFDGRINMTLMFLGMSLGALMNIGATASELNRSDQSKNWFRDTLNAAMIGDMEKVKNNMTGENE